MMNKHSIKQMIGENRIEEAILALTNFFYNTPIRNQVIQQSVLFNEYLGTLHAGTSDEESLRRLKARITQALLAFTDKIPGEDNNRRNNQPGTFQKEPDFLLTLKKSEKERAELLRTLAVAEIKAQEKPYKKRTIEAFSTVFHELVSNAFQHGCTSYDDKITIRLYITSAYINLEITNPHPVSFDLSQKISTHMENLRRNSMQERGRGLILVSELADDFHLMGRTVFKAVFYKKRSEFTFHEIDSKMVLIDVKKGIRNPGFEIQLMHLVHHLSNQGYSQFLLSFRRFTASSRITRVNTIMIQLHKLLTSLNKKIAIVLRSDKELISSVIIPQVICAYTWETALKMVGRPELLAPLAALAKRENI